MISPVPARPTGVTAYLADEYVGAVWGTGALQRSCVLGVGEVSCPNSLPVPEGMVQQQQTHCPPQPPPDPTPQKLGICGHVGYSRAPNIHERKNVWCLIVIPHLSAGPVGHAFRAVPCIGNRLPGDWG